MASLEAFKLVDVQVTDRELGNGSYATVLELKYMGMKCAGKKIHQVLLKDGETTHAVRRFEEECRILSKTRHPNIVQFLGVFFQQNSRLPILVMEFLPINLTTCIEKYHNIPKEIVYSILHDVALGLCYLHSQSPPIIHRDLCSNNILLTSSMTAKVSDLGVARIIELPSSVAGKLTQVPGTPSYMPPEVMVAKPNYNTSVDIFSFGILMIHCVSGEWPVPQVGQVRTEGTQMIPVSEAERRQEFLDKIGNEHPLMGLILGCISNNPDRRTPAHQIVKRLVELVQQYPMLHGNKLDMIQEMDAREKALNEAELRHAQQTKEIERQLSFSDQESLRQKSEEIVKLRQLHTTEIDQLNRTIAHVRTQMAVVSAEKEVVCREKSFLVEENKDLILEVNAQKEMISRQSKSFDLSLKKIEDEYALQLSELEKSLQNEKQKCERLVEEQKQLETRMSQQIKRSQSLTNEKVGLLSELARTQALLESQITTSASLRKDIATRDKRIECKIAEIEAKAQALQDHEATITAMKEQIAKNGTEKQPQFVISWKQCANLPTSMYTGQSITVNGKVYFGGGMAADNADKYLVYCYEPSADQWSTLPPLPVRYFRLGKVEGTLVAVGGLSKVAREYSRTIYSFDEVSREWKQSIPPMPTARHTPVVVSFDSALVVAGGTKEREVYADVVEIYLPKRLKWFRSDPVPVPCQSMSAATIATTLYVNGGYEHPSFLNQSLCASVDDLTLNAVTSSQSVRRRSSSRSAWKTLPNSPNYTPAAASIAGSLLSIGGYSTLKGDVTQKEVFMYSSARKSWTHVSDLPEPRSNAAAVMMSPLEILVIGGWYKGAKNTVYKGTLAFL